MSVQKIIWIKDLNEMIREMNRRFPQKKPIDFGEEVMPVYRYEVDMGDMKASFCEMGASLTTVMVKDRWGNKRDVVLGVDSPEACLYNWPAFGAVIGRCANRISGASFTLKGEKYRLEENIEGGCLHSGYSYHYRKWDSKTYEDEKGAHIIFGLVSEDGDQGFPGRLSVEVEYLVAPDCSITLHYRYCSDKDTVVNLTNHSYFNLSGHDSGTVLDHRLCVHSEYVTAVDRQLMPTGEVMSVEGSAFDFREMTVIRDNMEKPFLTFEGMKDYDINYVVNSRFGSYRHVAELLSEESGIGLRVYTDMPGMQLYTANALERAHGKNGVRYTSHPGICFETQFYPDAVNIPQFPSPILRAGEVRNTTTRFAFYHTEPF